LITVWRLFVQLSFAPPSRCVGCYFRSIYGVVCKGTTIPSRRGATLPVGGAELASAADNRRTPTSRISQCIAPAKVANFERARQYRSSRLTRRQSTFGEDSARFGFLRYPV